MENESSTSLGWTNKFYLLSSLFAQKVSACNLSVSLLHSAVMSHPSYLGGKGEELRIKKPRPTYSIVQKEHKENPDQVNGDYYIGSQPLLQGPQALLEKSNLSSCFFKS